MFAAVLDANVLVPLALADTLLRTAEVGLYRPFWSLRILNEVKQAIVKVKPDVAPTRIDARLADMRRVFPDSCVFGWEVLVDQVTSPDENDRHVVAAARLARADVIVTRNLTDFPVDSLARWDLEVVDPDCFLLDMLDMFKPVVLRVIREQASDKTRPPLAVEDVLIALGRAGVPGFARQVGSLFRS
ncbi:MAG: PIN domain-containing protein [Propionibacteriaceae bacterium]|nr:PIN domain-containing protein [Propionibacteriaceae bacterium]